MRRVLGEDRRAYHRSVLASRPTYHQRINIRMVRKGRITLRTKFLKEEKAQNILAQRHPGTILELGTGRDTLGLARRGTVGVRPHGPIKEEVAGRDRGKPEAEQGLPEGVRHLAVPVTVETGVTAEVVTTATFARTRMTATTRTKSERRSVVPVAPENESC